MQAAYPFTYDHEINGAIVAQYEGSAIITCCPSDPESWCIQQVDLDGLRCGPNPSLVHVSVTLSPADPLEAAIRAYLTKFESYEIGRLWAHTLSDGPAFARADAHQDARQDTHDDARAA